LAVAAAKHGLGYGEMSYRIDGRVRSERLRRITEILNRLEHKQEGAVREKPNWQKELAYVRAGKGDLIPVTVVCDVYAADKKRRERLAFELKAPMPNSDQTKVSKEKIMKLYCMEPSKIDAAYYALPYNPYGRKEDYAWTYPARWFNMKEDEVVLIGDEFWDRIGGRGTYESFIRAVNEIGKEYRDRIYREYLGIEPPANADEKRL
jgi:Type II restriction endonuclease, TdeIII